MKNNNNNKNHNLQVLKEAGVYTVVETRGFLKVPIFFPFPSLLIGISVTHLFGKERLQRGRTDSCLGVEV